MRRISMAEGEARGEANAKREMALRMLSDGVSLELVAKYSELTIDEVKELNAKRPA